MANTDVISQGVSGTTGTAMAGAAIGTMIAPGIGTAIGAGVGAVVGAVSGVFSGLSTSRKKKKQKRYLRLAYAAQQEREANVAEAQFLSDFRKARITRASSLAQATAANIATSSLATSALSSIGSQLSYNINSLAEDRRLYSIYAQYMQKAQQAAEDYAAKSAMYNQIYSTLGQAGKTALGYMRG